MHKPPSKHLKSEPKMSQFYPSLPWKNQCWISTCTSISISWMNHSSKDSKVGYMLPASPKNCPFAPVVLGSPVVDTVMAFPWCTAACLEEKKVSEDRWETLLKMDVRWKCWLFGSPIQSALTSWSPSQIMMSVKSWYCENFKLTFYTLPKVFEKETLKQQIPGQHNQLGRAPRFCFACSSAGAKTFSK